MTVEADGTGALYPVVYVAARRDRLEEHALPAHPLLDFATMDARRRRSRRALDGLLPGSRAVGRAADGGPAAAVG